jgi:hypothetical protein
MNWIRRMIAKWKEWWEAQDKPEPPKETKP